MRNFHMSEKQALNYPVNRAFALAAFDAETNPACPLERDSDGYLAQEADD
jgi:hypothetical protein